MTIPLILQLAKVFIIPLNVMTIPLFMKLVTMIITILIRMKAPPIVIPLVPLIIAIRMDIRMIVTLAPRSRQRIRS